ncbi:MAG TPA: sigma factor, partial [Chthoniobacterales bacterium]|nr:sigma factor [Chthoniobacterales bacterium]
MFPLPMSDVPLLFPPSRKKAPSSDAKRQSRADADREMMRCFTSGDEAGFATFYRRFAPGLFSLVYRILQEQKESEDVLQEAFVQMWKNTATYD